MLSSLLLLGISLYGSSASQLSEPDPEAGAIKRLGSSDVEVRRRAAASFQFDWRGRKEEPNGVRSEPTFPKNAIPALLKALSDQDTEVRAIVASTFGKFGQGSKYAIPLLGDLLSDKELRVRIAASFALLELGSLSGPVLDKIKKSTDDANELVSIYSWGAMLCINSDLKNGIDFLSKYRSAMDITLKSASIEVMFYIGNKAVPTLESNLEDKEPLMREWTLRALYSIANNCYTINDFPDSCIRRIIERITDENAEVASCAIELSVLFGDRGKGAVPSLIELIQNKENPSRLFAIASISKFGSASELAIPALIDASSDTNLEVKMHAEKSLKEINKYRDRAKKPY